MNEIQNNLSFIRSRVQRKNRKYQTRFGTSDVVQECAVQLLTEFRSRQNKHEEPQPIRKSWLAAVATRVAANLRRACDAQCRSIEVEESATDFVSHQRDVTDQVLANEMSARLLHALGELSAIERQVLSLKYQRQFTFEAISKELDISSKRVQRIRNAAIAKLQKSLTEQ